MMQNKKLGKGDVHGSAGKSTAKMKKAIDAVKDAVEKLHAYADVEISPANGKWLEVRGSYSLSQVKENYDYWAVGWEKSLVAAVKQSLSAAGFSGKGAAQIESAHGYVSYGPGIGVPMNERASWNFSLEVKLP